MGREQAVYAAAFEQRLNTIGISRNFYRPVRLSGSLDANSSVGARAVTRLAVKGGR